MSISIEKGGVFFPIVEFSLTISTHKNDALKLEYEEMSSSAAPSSSSNAQPRSKTRRTPRALFTSQEIRRSILLVVQIREYSAEEETTRDFSKVCRSNYYLTSRTRLLTTSPLFNDRVIQALTANIDLSSLFADVLMNAATGDIATKKMLYHYIGVYSDKSKESEELAMMTINTLQKDTKHEDPTIRGLAIRSMTSLRSKSLVEYSIECVKEGPADAHPYARRGVPGVFESVSVVLCFFFFRKKWSEKMRTF